MRNLNYHKIFHELFKYTLRHFLCTKPIEPEHLQGDIRGLPESSISWKQILKVILVYNNNDISMCVKSDGMPAGWRQGRNRGDGRDSRDRESLSLVCTNSPNSCLTVVVVYRIVHENWQQTGCLHRCQPDHLENKQRILSTRFASYGDNQSFSTFKYSYLMIQ